MAIEVNPKLSTDLYFSPLKTINLFLKSVNLFFFWGKHFWWTWIGHSLEWDAFQPNGEHFTIAFNSPLRSAPPNTHIHRHIVIRKMQGLVWLFLNFPGHTPTQVWVPFCVTLHTHTFIPVDLGISCNKTPGGQMKLLKPSGQLDVRWNKLPLLQAAVPRQPPE